MYLDIPWELKSNPAFARQIESITSDLANLEELVESYPQHRPRLDVKMTELIQACDYNMGLLVPYYFPQYPKENPMSLFDRPYSFAIFNFQIGGFTVIRASRQIGKSSTIGAREKILCDLLPAYRTLYIAPHQENIDTYANRLKEMDRAFRFPTLNAKFRQNLGYKEYANGSVMELIRVLASSQDARGKTADTLIYDEYQHFDASLEADIQQCQTSSDMPQTIYSGTSITIDTALEDRWLQSSQGTWHIFCECGKEIDCGSAEEVLPIIQPEGPACSRCSRLLDVTQGRFVHAFSHLLDVGWIGLHVPQLIIPEFSNDSIKWSKIYQNFCDYETSKFLQEVMGIATLEGAREITVEDLHRMCCLGENAATVQARAKAGYYKWVVSGCDWGGSDWQPSFQQKVSTTVHAMLGVRHDGDIDVVHMQRYGGMGYREIANSIADTHKRLGGGPIATDFGVGSAYNMLLREHTAIVADRHLIFDYTAPKTALLAAPSKEGLHNMYMLNRTESITTLFQAIKRLRKSESKVNGELVINQSPNPRIRCYNWEQASPLLLDFLNLVRAPTESASGVGSFKYRRHGSKPDDTLHAFNFAYALIRVLLGEPIVEDRGLKQRLEELLKVRAAPSLGGLTSSKIRVISG
jgi:hypothetical protein